MATLAEAVQACTALTGASSAYLSSIAEAQSPPESRELTRDEVATLRANGNRVESEDWSRVRVGQAAAVAGGFSAARVVNCTFGGRVVLGATSGTVSLDESLVLEAGLRGSCVVDAVIGNGALVADTRLLARTVVGDGAVVLGCGLVSCSQAGTSFGNGVSLPVGVEIGGRDVACFAEMRFDYAVAAGSHRDDDAGQAAYASAVSAYAQRAHSAVTIVRPGAVLLNTPRVVDAYVGAHALVDAATEISNATILAESDERSTVSSGAVVRNALLQWACAAEGMALVDTGVLFEHSHVERHGKLLESILGPNSGVAEGEVTASLVGPFVGFHHQALLIACFWPDGKGNIGYGANVGSNHTLKAPDQELWPGEGCFFGLGTCIKYPTNMRRAPYTVVATGATTLPQVLAMPFSLINMAGESIAGLSPAINELMPGWVLSDALFSVLRNEDKFAKRNKARRNAVDQEVFKPCIVDWMLEARKQLVLAEGKAKFTDGKGGAIYTEKDCPGIGKNYMSERARAKGVEAYTFFARLYALRGLAARLRNGDDASTVLTRATPDLRWEHERSTLLAELSAEANGGAGALMQILAAMQAEVAKSAELSKSRDDKRGKRIIPDYDLVHKPAADEKVVVAARRLADDLKTFAAKL